MLFIVSCQVFEIRKTRGGAILDGEDEIQSVLDNNDFVSVGKIRLALQLSKC